MEPLNKKQRLDSLESGSREHTPPVDINDGFDDIYDETPERPRSTLQDAMDTEQESWLEADSPEGEKIVGQLLPQDSVSKPTKVRAGSDSHISNSEEKNSNVIKSPSNIPGLENTRLIFGEHIDIDRTPRASVSRGEKHIQNSLKVGNSGYQGLNGAAAPTPAAVSVHANDEDLNHKLAIPGLNFSTPIASVQERIAPVHEPLISPVHIQAQLLEQNGLKPHGTGNRQENEPSKDRPLDTKQPHINGASDLIKDSSGEVERTAEDRGRPHGTTDVAVKTAHPNEVGEDPTLKPQDNLNHTEKEFYTDGDPLQQSHAKAEAGQEFEFDSSDQPNSLSSTDSSSDDSDESDDGDDDYKLLSPEEQARLLMRGDGESDEEGNGKADKKSSVRHVRTKNEVIDKTVAKPDIVISETAKIDELGSVESLLDSLILVKARVSGECRVLDEGSILCLADRTVIGVVAELLGTVQAPRYSVRFNTNEEISAVGIQKETKIFYSDEHSKFVFTAPLQRIKGSDASNLYDEEPAEHEMEFSDDEAEMEYKRQLKQHKRDRAFGRAARSDNEHRSDPLSLRSASPGTKAPEELDYDEQTSTLDDDLYTPLTRPRDYRQLMHRPDMPSSNGRPIQRGGRRGRGASKSYDTSDRLGRHDSPRNDTKDRRMRVDSRGGRGRGPRRPDNRGNQQFSHRNERREAKVEGDVREYNPRRPSQEYPEPPRRKQQYPPPSIQQNPYAPRDVYHTGLDSSTSRMPMSFPAPFASSPTSMSVPMQQDADSRFSGIPSGAYINPTFFQMQQTTSPPLQQSPGPSPQQWNPQASWSPQSWQAQGAPALQPQQLPGSAYSYHQPYSLNFEEERGRTSPEVGAASRAAEEKLDILRRLSKQSGSP